MGIIGKKQKLLDRIQDVLMDMREHILSYSQTVRKYWDIKQGQEQATLLRGTIFGLYNENETMTLIVHIIIMLTFPIFDMFIMFFIRRKWYKEFILHKKSAKVQEFRE